MNPLKAIWKATTELAEGLRAAPKGAGPISRDVNHVIGDTAESAAQGASKPRLTPEESRAHIKAQENKNAQPSSSSSTTGAPTPTPTPAPPPQSEAMSVGAESVGKTAGDAGKKMSKTEAKAREAEALAEARRLELIKEERARAAAEVAEKAKKAEAAESVISSSLTDMYTVMRTNGKMPKQAFFAELQNALRDKNLLTAIPEGGRVVLKTPKEIFERIRQRQSVSEGEMGVLAEYFARFHNDTKMAKELAQQAVRPAMMPAGSPVGATVQAIASRIPVSEGVRATPTFSQRHAWETGGTSFILNRLSAFQERFWRTTGGYVAAGATALVAQQTYSTYHNFEDPNFIGRAIIGTWTKDKAKDVDDYVEFAHGRLNADTARAMDNLKKYYNITKFDDSNKKDAVEALLNGPKPPYNPTPDMTQALIMFVSQKVYGKAVASTAELKDLMNEQTKKANDAIDRAADTAKANAGKKDQEIADLKQAARTAGAPTGLLDDLPGAKRAPTPAEKSTQRAPEVLGGGLTGNVFKERLDDLKADGTISDEQHRQLATAFKGATKAQVSDADEFTARNRASSAELGVFARNAEEIFSRKGYPASAVQAVVQSLVAPAP